MNLTFNSKKIFSELFFFFIIIIIFSQEKTCLFYFNCCHYRKFFLGFKSDSLYFPTKIKVSCTDFEDCFIYKAIELGKK